MRISHSNLWKTALSFFPDRKKAVWCHGNSSQACVQSCIYSSIYNSFILPSYICATSFPFYKMEKLKPTSHSFSMNYRLHRDFPAAQMVKNLPAMQETQVLSLSQEDPLEKEMVTHSSSIAWRIPWTKEPGGLQSMGSQRVGCNWATNTHADYLDRIHCSFNKNQHSFYADFKIFLTLCKWGIPETVSWPRGGE